jgi:hypothetical protein
MQRVSQGPDLKHHITAEQNKNQKTRKGQKSKAE